MMHPVDRIRRVLVIDDQPVISDSMALIFCKRGYATRAVYSGEQALEVARVFLPDVLISDVMMAGITGIEAANEVLSFLPECKVILLSGQAATVDALSRSRKAGKAFEVLLKPVSPDLLLELVSKLA